MPTAHQDTEITLGTGRMLGIFFAFVLVCAFFFAIGFSLGRKTTLAGAGVLRAPTGAPSTIVRPSAAKNDSLPPAGDFSFYKAVGEKSTDAALTPPDSKAQPAPPPPATATSTAEMPKEAPKEAPDTGNLALSTSGYYVQVAAVSRQEDAEALVEALKKKQYPAFIANNPSVDKFHHVQVGPYAELKDAEAMRTRLVSDGYNPIVKK